MANNHNHGNHENHEAGQPAQASGHRAHVAEHKKQKVQAIAGLLDSYPIVAVVNMANLPAKQLQNMRGQLRSSVVMYMSKRTFISKALDTCKKPGIQELKGHLGGMPALLFAKENPFRLYKMIEKRKSKAPIKPGQTAPNDIMVPAGATNFAPGPIIGELGQFRIKTGIEGGKIVIKDSAVVAKKGDVVKPALASILLRLGIEPMEIGLDLVVAYENGELLTKDMLSIDEKEYLARISLAASDAMKLAMEIAYPSPETIRMLLAKSHLGAKAAAMEAGVLSKDTLELLAKAEAQASTLQSKVQ
jgi:large subunit ribosomal protein L10